MELVEKNYIRTLFSRAMSAMYQTEVPQYTTLLSLVKEVNQETLEQNPDLKLTLEKNQELERISEERHGAIRLGTAEELRTIKELFAVMGMYPVNYYDLSIAGIPVHSTAFRPIADEDLKRNPFRVFTSLLRTELISETAIRKKIMRILQQREIFTPGVKRLIQLNQSQNGLTEQQAEEFVHEALETFRWHQEAIVSLADYEALKKIHPLLADVVSFKGPHINHLTPRTLNIDLIQEKMTAWGLHPKAVIEGPPARTIPILLRQTSFKALEEPILFPDDQGQYRPGKHQARFGEIEQRGGALTPKGHRLYEQLTAAVREQITPNLDGSNAADYKIILETVFQHFPDDLESLRQQGLIYLNYHVSDEGINDHGKIKTSNLTELIQRGYLDYHPVIYEDFLPVSAAGIFTSNLGDTAPRIKADANQAAFEQALGAKVINAFDLYQQREARSLKQALAILNKEE